MPESVRFGDVYRAALRKWLRSPAMWLLASVGFLPALFLAQSALTPGAFAENVPPMPLEVILVVGSACFAAAIPLAPVVALAMALRFWRRSGLARAI